MSLTKLYKLGNSLLAPGLVPSRLLRNILRHIAVWIIAPIIIGLLSTLGSLYMLRGAPLHTSPTIDTTNAQYDWERMVWIVNTTDRGYQALIWRVALGILNQKSNTEGRSCDAHNQGVPKTHHILKDLGRFHQHIIRASCGRSFAMNSFGQTASARNLYLR